MENEEVLEILGEIVESCLNFAEYGAKSTTPAFAQGLPSEMRIDALSNGIEEVKERVLGLYRSLGGEDVWF